MLKSKYFKIENYTHNKHNPQTHEEKLNYGRWTNTEHKDFIEGLIMHGNNWHKISKKIKSRNRYQVCSHAQKFFQQIKRKISDKNFLDFEHMMNFIIFEFFADYNEIINKTKHFEKLFNKKEFLSLLEHKLSPKNNKKCSKNNEFRNDISDKTDNIDETESNQNDENDENNDKNDKTKSCTLKNTKNNSSNSFKIINNDETITVISFKNDYIIDNNNLYNNNNVDLNDFEPLNTFLSEFENSEFNLYVCTEYI
jgi:SHAQKYF class myb-like DNA-binding protein